MNLTRSPLEIAASLLAQEEVVAIPTETVYGLAGNAFSEKAIDTIFLLKNRPRTNPLIVHVPNLEAALPLVHSIPEKLLLLAQQCWPGPLTLLVDKSEKISNKVTAGSQRVAIRVPAHPLALELLKICNFPLVAPSANPYTRISPTKASHVKDYFGSTLKYILDGGDCQVGVESTIVGMENDCPVIFRKGVIHKRDLEQLIGPISDFVPSGETMPTPGLASRHYAPLTETILCPRNQMESYYEDGVVFLLFSTAFPSVPTKAQFILSKIGSMEQAAKKLYQFLHTLDQTGYKKIICEELPEEGVGIALNDRLRRASWNSKVLKNKN